MSKQVKSYELSTYSKRSWSLTKEEFDSMNERLEAGARFLVIPDDSQSKVSSSDIKFIGKRQMTLGDSPTESKSLQAGEIKFNPIGEGYIKFIATSIRVSLKNDYPFPAAASRLSDEQRNLVNEELLRQKVEYRL